MGRVYDEAAAHRDDLPGDLPRKAGATHLGMFFAWCALRGLASDWHGAFDPERLERLKRRELTGRDYVLTFLDGKLTDEHLTPAGQAFAASYLASGRYLADYTAALAADLPSPYHVADTWENLDRLAPMLDTAFTAPDAAVPPPEAGADEEADKAATLPGAAPLPEPRPLPDPAPLPEPEPLPATEPLPETASLPETEPLPAPEPEPPVAPAPEPAARPEPTPEPAREPVPRPDLGIPHEDEAFAPYEEVLRSSGGPHGGPVIVSEPDDGAPVVPEGDDGDAAWTWEQTVRRAREVAEEEHEEAHPPPLPRMPERKLPRLSGTGPSKSKAGCLGAGGLWVGIVIFMLIYGCTRAVSSAPAGAPTPELERMRFEDEEMQRHHDEALKRARERMNARDRRDR